MPPGCVPLTWNRDRLVEEVAELRALQFGHDSELHTAQVPPPRPPSHLTMKLKNIYDSHCHRFSLNNGYISFIAKSFATY